MPVVSNRVRFYHSQMPGAPAVSGSPGALIEVLRACLVDGFGTRAVDSLHITDGLATAVISAGHGFVADQVVRLAGAATAKLNADWRISLVTADSFSFSVEGLGIPNGSVYGALTAMTAPAGWEVAFSDTNKVAFKGGSVEGSGHLLLVDDTDATTARTCAYKSMTDINTGTGRYPDDTQHAGGLYVGKANSTTGTRKWLLVADDRAMTVCTAYHANYTDDYGVWFFGDLVNAAVGDTDACVIAGYASFYNAITNYINSNTQPEMFTRRGASKNIYSLEYGAPTAMAVIVGGEAASGSSSSYPAGPGAFGEWGLMPIVVGRNGSLSSPPKGQLPAIRHASHSRPDSPTNSLSRIGRFMVVQDGGQFSASQWFAVDVIGPWGY